MAKEIENRANNRAHAEDRKRDKEGKKSHSSSSARKFKAVCTFMFFTVLLGCFVWTKVSFLAISEAIHDDLNISTEKRCRMFVMLQVMILVPNLFNLLRGFVCGWFRKDVNSPDTRQVFAAAFISLLDATGICLFTFNIPVRSKSHHVILLMSCVYVIPLLVWTIKYLRDHIASRGTNDNNGSGGTNDSNVSGGTNDNNGSCGENENNASGWTNDNNSNGGTNDINASGGTNDNNAIGGINDNNGSGGENENNASGGTNDNNSSGGTNDNNSCGGTNDNSASGGTNDNNVCGETNDNNASRGTNDDNASGGKNDDNVSGGTNDDNASRGTTDYNASRGSNGNTVSRGSNDVYASRESNDVTASQESKYLVIIALLFEIIALGITVNWLRESPIHRLLMAPIGILCLSVSWTSNIQNFLVQQKQNGEENKNRPPTWKIVAIMAVFKLMFTFGISYMIFVVKELSPFPTATPTVTWSNYTSGWDWKEWQSASDHELSFFVSHIMCGITGYMITSAAIKARMQRPVLIPALLLCSPITILVLVLPGPCHWIIIRSRNASIITDCIIGKNNDVLDILLVIVAVVLFFLAVTLSSVWVLWKTKYLCNLREDQLFWLPSYNSIFLDQWIMLNRKNENDDAEHMDPGAMSNKTWIYLCTTMYRETEGEMDQFLMSIKDVQTAQSKTGRNVEAHIFFDDAFDAGTTNLNSFAKCLVSLVESTLDLKKKSTSADSPSTSNEQNGHDSESTELKTYETPYGKRYSWTMKGKDTKNQHTMPFHIHFKDASKVKKKKRWSQIMYMQYVIYFFLNMKEDRKEENKEHLSSEEKGDRENKRKKYEHSYLLVTDADVKFNHKSVEYLIDLMLRDRSVGAACARTYPLGSGPLVWYQEFEYAIGHWFQKAAENVLGTVLCSPGCFSIYRCEAVKDVLQLYAEDVKCAFDVLTKDMGEDRWFCTLMVQHGWFIEYCAAASNETHCPVNFEEYFKQRRRWIVSTLANLQLFLQNWDLIKKNNNRVSILFRVYQAALLFATVVGPSTIILVVSGGLKYGWDLNPIPTLVTQLVLCITFGIICVFTSSAMQISAAKVFTISYAIIMTPVLVGMAVQITTDFIQTPDAEPNYISANIKVSTTTVYLCAMTGIFVITGILHTMEMFYLFHGIWYLLCLPGGYLILTIYSICNITDNSWGTREINSTDDAKKKPSSKLQSWSDMFLAIYKICSCCAKKKTEKGKGLRTRKGRDVSWDAESGTITGTDEGGNNGSDTSQMKTKESILKDGTSEPTTGTLKDGENTFWTELVEEHLKPKDEEERYAEDLVELRNEWLMVLTVSNLLWLILITTLSYKGDILNVYGTSILGLAVLVMLGILSLIQFLAMLTHRLFTFVHYLGRVPIFVFDEENNQKDSDTQSWTEYFRQMCKCQSSSTILEGTDNPSMNRSNL